MKKTLFILLLLTALCALPAIAQASVTLDEAKAIALEHAGVLTQDALFIQAQLEYDDNRQVYDLEFVAQGREFDYEVDAETGEVLGYDADADAYDAQSGTITAEAALSIALEKAGATREQVKVTKAQRDLDDGRAEYEIEFVLNGLEYECSVDAATGAITEWDKDD